MELRLQGPHKSYPAPAPLGQETLAGIAQCESPVLIVGERGSGKRSLATWLYAHSLRSMYPLVEIKSAEADADSVLSALSGKGTLYLSEVGELSYSLQESIVEMFCHSGKPPAGRLLCGTARDLPEDVKNWRVREDFYYLASTVSVHVWPLRCRKHEILSLADQFLTEYCKDFDCPKPVLHQQVIQFLLEHNWPDNLPELQTAMKTLIAIGDQSVSLAALTASASNARRLTLRRNVSLKQAARSASSQIERKLISDVLIATGGNRKRAAAELGISYKTLLYKLKHARGHSGPAAKHYGVEL